MRDRVNHIKLTLNMNFKYDKGEYCSKVIEAEFNKSLAITEKIMNASIILLNVGFVKKSI